MTQIIGREEELASVLSFVDEVPEGLSALVLEGEAGIGKSTLWLAGVEHARTRGLRVLSSRPAEAERGLAYVGLGDLFEDVLDEVLPALSLPRRRALEIALLLEEAADDEVDTRALGIATRSALQLLAEDGPLLVAIDDLQWFDAASRTRSRSPCEGSARARSFCSSPCAAPSEQCRDSSGRSARNRPASAGWGR